MPAAARVGDPVVHTQALPQAEHGWLMGALKGALVGVALVGIAAVGVALTVGTAGFGTPFVVGAALVVGGAVLKYGAAGFNEGAQAGAQQTVSAGQILTGSSNVYINSRKAAAACMSLANCSQHGPGKLVATGSPKVYINRKAASRTGDLGNCSFQIGPGSPNVVIGGGTGACTAISGEIPAWLQKAVNISFIAGNVMMIAGGFAMGGVAGLRGLFTLHGAAVGAAFLGAGMVGGHLAGEWAKNMGLSPSTQMAFQDIGGALTGLAGIGLLKAGPPTLRALGGAADNLGKPIGELVTPEGVRMPGGSAGSQQGWAEQFMIRPEPSEPLQMSAEDGGGGTLPPRRVPVPTNDRGGYQPSDFDVTSIADNPEQHEAWQQAIQDKTASPRNNDYKRYLDIMERGDTPTHDQAEAAYESVRSQYTKIMRENGNDMSNIEVHHWNYSKGDYPEQVVDPRNLFHVPDRYTGEWNSHTEIHRLTTSDPGKLWEGPIGAQHELPVDASYFPLAPPEPEP